MTDSILSLQNVTTKIDGKVLHDRVDLEIKRGEIVGIVGGSGSGKSVLLRVILGLMAHASGTIHILGKHLDNDKDAKKIYQQCAVMFQSGALFSSLTVLQNIQLPLREIAGMSIHESYDVAMSKLKMVGLQDSAAPQYPAKLSGGMIKRAALARALALDAELLFLDEPTAGLDPISAEAFDNLLKQLQQDYNLTCVMVTHDLDSLYTVCNRVAALVDRKIIVGTINELIQNPHPWIQSYFMGPRGRAAQNTLKEN